MKHGEDSDKIHTWGCEMTCWSSSLPDPASMDTISRDFLWEQFQKGLLILYDLSSSSLSDGSSQDFSKALNFISTERLDNKYHS